MATSFDIRPYKIAKIKDRWCLAGVQYIQYKRLVTYQKKKKMTGEKPLASVTDSENPGCNLLENYRSALALTVSAIPSETLVWCYFEVCN